MDVLGFEERGIHLAFCTRATWIPAFAGMTARNHGVLRKIKSLAGKKMKPKHLQHLPRVAKIFPGQQCAKAGIHSQDASEQMDSSLLKAEYIHVLSPRARFRGNDVRRD